MLRVTQKKLILEKKVNILYYTIEHLKQYLKYLYEKGETNNFKLLVNR